MTENKWLLALLLALPCFCGGTVARAALPAAAPAPTITSGPSRAIRCPAAVPQPASGTADDQVAGTPVGEMEILPITRWQPIGGEVQFKITDVGAPPEHVRVDFAWADSVKQDEEASSSHQAQPYAAGKQPKKSCFQSNFVRLIHQANSEDPAVYTYAATVPADLDSEASSMVVGWKHRAAFTHVVPLADVFVTADIPVSGGSNRNIVLVRPVGITTPWIAFVLALGLVAVGWLVLFRWARHLDIKGGPLIRILSTPDGTASLSQFQILIWTCVIGAGVTYVMLLSGNLIDIPGTTLALLGVTGFALIGSRVLGNTDGTPKHASAPGVVTGLSQSGTATDTVMVLTWNPPSDTAQPFAYTVQLQKGGDATWTEIANGLAAPPFAVTGLSSGESYHFRVFALNAAGAGPACMLLAQSTAKSTPQAPGAPAGPAQVPGLSATANPDGSVALRWSRLAPEPDAYTVQFRTTGTLPWSTFDNAAGTPATLTGLHGATRYQFQVFASSKGYSGPPSSIASATTAQRLPHWSDLVTTSGSDVEIDLGRLQMLVFTTIAALFTGLTLLATGQIPEIPNGELALVGLSNSIYLTHKAVSRRR